MVGKQTVKIRVICINPPVKSDDRGLEFGLQDKARVLQLGQVQGDGSISYDCSLEVKRDSESGKPNFTGAYAHGTPQDRFLYLTLRPKNGAIIKRIKVKLGSITWEQVQQAGDKGMLEASVDGTGAASVRLLGEGWVLRL